MQLVAQIAQRRTHHHIVFLSAELHQLYPALGKGFDVTGKGEAQQTADFQRRGPLRIDSQINAQLVLEQIQAFVVLRVTDARNGVLSPQTLGHQAAKHVGFIAGGGSDHNIRFVHLGIHQGLRVGTVAAHAHHIQHILAAVQHFLILIDNDYTMLFTGKIFSQRMTNFPIAHNQNPHKASSC